MEYIRNYIQRLKTTKYLIPILVATVLAFLMFLTIFMPYATATKEQAKMLTENPNYYVIEELKLMLWKL